MKVFFLLIVSLLCTPILVFPGVAQANIHSLQDGEWVRMPDASELPSRRLVSGRVVWPDGTPASGASVVLTIDDSATILENKYQSLLEMKANEDGGFVFMGFPRIQYVRVVAAARANELPSPRGEQVAIDPEVPDRVRWSFGQVSMESLNHEVKVRIVLDEPMLQARVRIVSEGIGTDGVAGVFLEPRTMGVAESHVGTYRTDPLHLFQKAEDMQRSDLPQEAPWFQELPLGKTSTVLLPAGRWRMWATAANHTMSGMVTIVCEQDGVVPKAEMSLFPTSGLVGRILSHAGVPVERAQVTLIFGEDYEQIQTDSNGAFQFLYAQAGQYKLWAKAWGHSTVYPFAMEIPVGGIRDYELKLGAPGAIQGQVDGAWMRPGLMVALHYHESDTPSQWVEVGSDGSFRIDGLTEEWYRLRLTAMPKGFRYWREDDLRDYANTEFSSRPAEHKGESPWDVPRIHKLFDESGVHMLRLYVESGATNVVAFEAPDEQNVRVTGVFDHPDNRDGKSAVLFRRMYDAAWTRVAWVEPNGNFAVDLPSTGEYQVHWIKDNLAEMSAPWSVDVKTHAQCRLELKAPNASLRVKFLDDQGKVVPASNHPFGERITLKHRTRFTDILPADPGESGEAVFDRLPPGPYVLYGALRQAVPVNDRNWKGIYSMPLWAVNKPVEITLGDGPVEITVPLSPAASVSGVVKDPNRTLQQNDVTGCAVYVWADAERSQSIHLESCEGAISSGYLKFQFSGLPHGDYFLSVEPTSWVDSQAGVFQSPMFPIHIEGSRMEDVRIELPAEQ